MANDSYYFTAFDDIALFPFIDLFKSLGVPINYNWLRGHIGHVWG